MQDTYSVASYVGQSHGKNVYNTELFAEGRKRLRLFSSHVYSWITDGSSRGPG